MQVRLDSCTCATEHLLYLLLLQSVVAEGRFVHTWFPLYIHDVKTSLQSCLSYGKLDVSKIQEMCRVASGVRRIVPSDDIDAGDSAGGSSVADTLQTRQDK